jgi:hypothetical protein
LRVEGLCFEVWSVWRSDYGIWGRIWLYAAHGNICALSGSRFRV